MEQPADPGVLAALGLKLATIVSGAVGSFISLRFFDGLTTAQKWTTFIGGWGLAAYLAAPLTAYFELRPALETGISLAVGLFGMSIAAAVIKVIRDTDWGGLVTAILNRKGGGGQ